MPMLEMALVSLTVMVAHVSFCCLDLRRRVPAKPLRCESLQCIVRDTVLPDPSASSEMAGSASLQPQLAGKEFEKGCAGTQ